jgi:DNA repair protein RadC
VISVGTLNSSLIHPREVFNPAIKASASSVVIVHNHPSGDCNPSKEDKEVTKMLNEAGRILGIKVLDHVIVGKDGFVGIKEKGNL